MDDLLLGGPPFSSGDIFLHSDKEVRGNVGGGDRISLEASNVTTHTELSVRNRFWRTRKDGLPGMSMSLARCRGARFPPSEESSYSVLICSMSRSGSGDENSGVVVAVAMVLCVVVAVVSV